MLLTISMISDLLMLWKFWRALYSFLSSHLKFYVSNNEARIYFFQTVYEDSGAHPGRGRSASSTQAAAQVHQESQASSALCGEQRFTPRHAPKRGGCSASFTSCTWLILIRFIEYHYYDSQQWDQFRVIDWSRYVRVRREANQGSKFPAVFKIYQT